MKSSNYNIYRKLNLQNKKAIKLKTYLQFNDTIFTIKENFNP